MSAHSFDPDIAARVGCNAAVIYQNLFYWAEKNAANDKHFYDGRWWTYNSISAFADLFPYLTGKQIRTALDKLEIDGLIVMHTCDNPPCVNPSHLILGTPKDNMSDRDNKNRQAKGENHGIAKLTDGDIYCIKKLNNRLSQRCIASIYKISQPQVSKIVNSISWKHIDGVKK